MSDEDNTRTVVSLLGADPGAGLAVPDTGAHLALYGFRDGRLFEVVSAATEDEYGARMIALGKSHRRGAFARLFRRP
jgi:hypothetical protein